MGFWWGRRFRLPGRMEPWPKLHRAYQARQKRGFLGPRIQSNGFARCAVEPFRQCLIPAITTGQPGNPVLLRQGLAGETACPTSIRSTLRAPFFSPNVETPAADRRSALLTAELSRGAMPQRFGDVLAPDLEAELDGLRGGLAKVAVNTLAGRIDGHAIWSRHGRAALGIETAAVEVQQIPPGT